MTINYSDKSTLAFSPIRGRHYLVSRGNTVTREIFYDENEPGPALPISPLIPIFERIFTFPLTFKTLMPEQDAIKKGLSPLMTYRINVSEVDSTGKEVTTTQRMCIVQRTIKDQHYLLDREVHPIEISIASSDGTEVKLIFTFTIQILDMELLLAKFPAGNFLQYAENSIIAKLRKVLPKKTFDEIRGVAKGPDGGEIGLQDDLEKIKNELNAQEFKKEYGFHFLVIMHENWILTKEAAERLKKIQDEQLEKIQKNIEITKAQGLAAATKLKGDAETDVLQKRKTDVGNAQTAVMTKRTIDVGAAEVTVLKNKIAAITPFQKLMNTNAATVSSNLKDLKGTLITDKGGIGGGTHLVEMMIANSIQNQQNLTDDTE